MKKITLLRDFKEDNRISMDLYADFLNEGITKHYPDDYLVSDAPYVPDQVQTVPVYENTNNVDIHLSSSHPAPATLHALSWEGDYIPRNYKRV